MNNFIFMCSGSLGTQILKDLIENSHMPACIFTDFKSDEIISIATENNIKLFKGNPRSSKGLSFLVKNKIDVELLLSVNYLYLIEKDIIDYPLKYAINIHGSLLPKYRGRAPHIWALINGESEIGATMHVIDEGCDTGDIIFQKKRSVDDETSGAEVVQWYSGVYFEMILEVLDQIEKNKSLVLTKQVESDSSYFPKRTPEDSRLNWNMTSVQIKRWVNALKSPYPCGFSYLNNEKVEFTSASIENYEYKEKFLPGEVVKSTLKYVVVKTVDGFITLEHGVNREMKGKFL